MKKLTLKLFPIALTIGLFALLSRQIPNNETIDLLGTFEKISASTLIFLAVSFLITLIIVAFRLILAYRQFYVNVPFRPAFEAVVSGAVSSLFLLPFVGNILGQGLVLRKVNAPAEITTLVCLYERAVMALSGLLISAIAAFMFFPSFQNIRGLHADKLIEIFFFLSASFVFVILSTTKSNREALKAVFSRHHVLFFTGTFLLAILGWALMALGYVVLINNLNPGMNLWPVFASAIMISFAASLPLSVSGWGVREYISLLLFTGLGATASAALGSAISIGLLSFVWLMLSAAMLYVLNRIKSSSPTKVTFTKHGRDTKTNLISILMYGCVASICFQIHLNWNEFTLNINFADIFALCALGLTLLDILEKRFTLSELGRPTVLFLIASTATLTFSLLWGIASFGFTAWAFYNKFLGWFVLWGYALLAFRFFQETGMRGLKDILRLLVAILVVTTIYKIGLFVFRDLGFVDPDFAVWPFSGFFANRTGFVLLATFVVTSYLTLVKTPTKLQLFFAALIYAGMMCTFARSAVFFLPLIPMFFYLTKTISLRDQAYLILMTFISYAVMIFALYYLPALIQKGASILTDAENFQQTSAQFAKNIVTQHSDGERVYTLIEGFRMWATNPFLGTGLGAFINNEVIAHSHALVIHSTPLWLLAEMGTIGALPFFAYAAFLIFVLGKHIVSKGRNLDKPVLLFILFIMIFGALSLPHEILYQRIVWVMFGFVLASNRELLKISNS